MEERRTYIVPTPLFMEERRTYICPPFCWRANKQDYCLILWCVRLLYHTSLLQDILYPQPRNRKKCLWQHLLPDIAEKLTSPYSCKGLECKKYTEIEVQEKKSVAMATLVARCCRKAN